MQTTKTLQLFSINTWGFNACWVAAAILVMWLNADGITSLYYPAAAESSPRVNSLRYKLYRLEQVLGERRSNALTNWERPVQLAKATRPVIPPVPAPAMQKEEIGREVDPPVLPKLSGIIMVGGAGASQYSAVLDGTVRSTNEAHSSFRVEEITSNGVVLSRNKKKWFIAAPEVYFSVELPK